MHTIKEASTREQWNFHAKVFSKSAFVYVAQDSETGKKSFKRIYSIHLVDAEGTTIELKTAGTVKIYTVDRKVKQDSVYVVKGNGPFAIPNRQYSTATFELWNRWFITPLEEEEESKFKMKSFLPCVNSIEAARKNLDKKARPENIVARCVGKPIKGPHKNIFNKPLVRGWYIKLCDAQGKHFYALVWHQQAILKKSPFQLFNCHENQPILLIGARASHSDSSNFTGDTTYTVTTNYPAILDPQSVARSKLAVPSNRMKQEIVAIL